MAQKLIDLETQHSTWVGDLFPVAFGKCNDNFAEIYGRASPVETITGLKMSRPTANSLTVSSGAAYVPGLNKIVVLPDPVSKAGIVVAAATWLHGYLFETPAGAADVEWVTTAPAAAYSGTARTKTGDASRRYLGSVRSGAANVIFKFTHALADGSISYNENTGGAPFTLVSAGQSTTPVSVSASAIVPVTGVKLSATILNATSSAYLHISNSEGPVAGVGFIGLASPGGVTAANVLLDASQQYTYAYETSPGSGGSFHRGNGYTFER